MLPDVPAAADADAGLVVAGDDVARRGRRAADGVVGRAGVEDDAAVAVEERCRSRGIGPDEVAGDRIAGRPGSVDADAGPVLPEMRLPAPAVVPPMVLLLAPLVTATPAPPLGIRAVPVALLPMKLPDTTFPVAAAPSDDHALGRVAGDHVSFGGGRASDHVVRRRDEHALLQIAEGGGSAGVGADEVGLEPVAAGTAEHDPHVMEAVDRQPADDAVGAVDDQAKRRSRVLAVDLDKRRSGIARLRRAVDDDRLGDVRQIARWRDRVRARTRDVERDRVARPGVVRVDDRLVERSGAAPVRVRHDQGAGPGRDGRRGEGRVVGRVGIGRRSGHTGRGLEGAARARQHIDRERGDGADGQRAELTSDAVPHDAAARRRSADRYEFRAGVEREVELHARCRIRTVVRHLDVVGEGAALSHGVGRAGEGDRELRRRLIARVEKHKELTLGRISDRQRQVGPPVAVVICDEDLPDLRRG